MNTFNPCRFSRPWLSATLWGIAVPLAASSLANAADDDEVFELSPFTITAEDSVGYQATSTLAGTRLRTDLKDIGSAISVVTAEFMEDIGATSVESLLTYTTGTEIGGVLGNFAGGSIDPSGRVEQNNARTNPDSNNRVRGLDAASLTRDFFLSDFGFDSYNTDRVTISRGPNSILFGIGSPGGVVDNTLKKAGLSKNKNEISFRFGQRGTKRGTLDINRVLIEDRLAFRLAYMDETIKFRQKPAFEDDTRIYGTLTAKLFKNEGVEWLDSTTLRATIEHADINGTPPNPIPPNNNIPSWFGPPTTPEIDAMTGVVYSDRANYTAPGYVYDQAHVNNLNGTPGASWRRAPEFYNMWGIMYADPTKTTPSLGFPAGSGFENLQGLAGQVSGPIALYDGTTSKNGSWNMESTRFNYDATLAPTFSNTSMPLSAYDSENLLLGGLTQYRDQKFDAQNFVIEQNFFNNKAGIELAFDKQKVFSTTSFPFGSGYNADVAIDVGLYATNGQANPNLGRPIITALNIGEHGDSWKARETKRVTAFYDLDMTQNDGWLRHFGRHVFTGLANASETETRSENWKFTWLTDPTNPNMNFKRDINQNIGAWASNFVALVYVGDDQRGAKSMDDIRLYNDYMRIDIPKVGDEFDMYYYNTATKRVEYGKGIAGEFLNGGNIGRQEIDSEAITWQGKFLNNSIVAMYGWREDSAANYERLNNIRNNTDGYLMSNLDTLKAAPSLDVSGQTRTKQIVGHLPRRWTEGLPLRPEFSAHYAESSNFQPERLRRDIDNVVLDFPSGATEEMGITIDVMEGKASLRLNWYETSSSLKDPSGMPLGELTNNPVIGWANRWAQAANNANFTFDDVGWDKNVLPENRQPSDYNPAAKGKYTSYEQVFTAIHNLLPPETYAAFDVLRTGSPSKGPGLTGDLAFEKGSSIQGMASPYDVTSKGFEFEAMYNPTKNWRIAFNAAKQQSINSNLDPAGERVILSTTQAIKDAGLWDMYDTPLNETATFGGRWTSGILAPYYAAKAKENTISLEQRKWRWNMVTNYSFSEGRLKGFGMGAAARWQDEVATGYKIKFDEFNNLIPDLDHPFMGGSEINGDVWFSYKHKISNGMNWKSQLNFVNAFGNDDIIPVITNPDGMMATYRTSPEKRWFLTNTLEF